MSDESRAVEHREGRTSRQEMEVRAPVERVWEAWADPAKISGWFMDRAIGPVEEGGTYTWCWDRYGVEVSADVLRVEPGRRLLLEAVWGPGKPTSIEVTLEDDGSGRTRVRTVQSGFGEGADWDHEYEGTHSGWRKALGMLKHYVEDHFGEPRSEFLVQADGSFGGKAVPDFYQTAEGLDRWLTTSARVGPEDGEVRLDLRDGGSLTGRVLARTESEILFSWNEEEGAALELMTHGTPDGGVVVAIRGSGWSRPEGWAEGMEERFRPVLGRLVAALEAS